MVHRTLLMWEILWEISKFVSIRNLLNSSKKFKELKDKRGTREFEEWFLSYRPSGKRKGEKDNGEKKKNNKSFKKTFKFRTWKNKNKTSKNKNELY